jgi:hypothetical protein
MSQLVPVLKVPLINPHLFSKNGEFATNVEEQKCMVFFLSKIA